MTFARFNLHQVWTPQGQEIGYADVKGHKQAYLNFSRIEFVGPALYTPTAKNEIGPGHYSVVTMESGMAYVVDGEAPVIADQITGVQALRRINCEKVQLAGGQVKAYPGGMDCWLAPDVVEAVDNVWDTAAGYTDGVARAVVLGRSGATYQVFGMNARTIAETRYWYWRRETNE